MWELAKICGKWFKYLTNGLIHWEMTQRFEKWLKYLGNGLDIWGTFSISGSAYVCCKSLKYLKYGFDVF